MAWLESWDEKARTEADANGVRTIYLQRPGEGPEGQASLAIILGHEAHRDGVVSADNEEETQRAVKVHTMMAARMIGEGQGMSLLLDSTLSADMQSLLQGDEAFSNYVNQNYDSSSDYWKLKVENGKIMLVYDGFNDIVDENGKVLRSHNPAKHAAMMQAEAMVKRMERVMLLIGGNPQTSAILEKLRGDAAQMRTEYESSNKRTDHQTYDVYYTLEETLTGTRIGINGKKYNTSDIAGINRANSMGVALTNGRYGYTTSMEGKSLDVTNYLMNGIMSGGNDWARNWLGSEVVTDPQFASLMNPRMTQAGQQYINGLASSDLTNSNMGTNVRNLTEVALNATGWKKDGRDALTNRVNGLLAGLVNGLLSGYGQNDVARDLYSSLVAKTQRAEAYREAGRNGQPYLQGGNNFDYGGIKWNSIDGTNPMIDRIPTQVEIGTTMNDNKFRDYACLAMDAMVAPFLLAGRFPNDSETNRLTPQSAIRLRNDAVRNGDIGLSATEWNLVKNFGGVSTYILQNELGIRDFELTTQNSTGSVPVLTIRQERGWLSTDNPETDPEKFHYSIGSVSGDEIFDSSRLSWRLEKIAFTLYLRSIGR